MILSSTYSGTPIVYTIIRCIIQNTQQNPKERHNDKHSFFIIQSIFSETYIPVNTNAKITIILFKIGSETPTIKNKMYKSHNTTITNVDTSIFIC